MSNPIATFDAVAAAVRDLRQAGDSPTAENVIRRIGGGSKRTVLDHLRLLRKGDGPPQPELPPSVLDIVRPALAELYAAGSAAEAERHRTRTERQDALMDEMEAQIVELAAENEGLQARIAGLEATNERIQADWAAAEDRLSARTVELDALRAESNRAAEGAGLADMMARIESSLQSLVPPQSGVGKRARPSAAIAADGGLFHQEIDKNE